MAFLKCKMCGGELTVEENSTIAVCEYCQSRQTVPALDDDKKLTLYGRANRLRMNCEFDKAAGVFEALVADFPEEAEGYWGLVLCKYGIEYVDDPATGKKIPTCHRTSYDCVMDDSDLEMALEYADPISKRQYREEAKQLEQIRKGIIELSAKEDPYDIFICYKETDERGQRTLDSVLSQDIYDALTAKGYRVFFARLSLEDKIGQEYEPYIFSALNTAKVMLVVGTDYDYFNAVWVKNEWSRFLRLMAEDNTKHLIPCFKGIDAYDMPKEFMRLQAQDMGKIGFMQDLLRGITKVMDVDKKPEPTMAQSAVALAGVEPLLKRVFMFLEDGDWKSANEYCEKVLDQDPECAVAYLGKLLAELRVKRRMDLAGCAELFHNKANFQKAIRFGDEDLKAELTEYIRQIQNRQLDNIYQSGCGVMETAKTEKDFLKAAEIFDQLNDYRDAAQKSAQCRENSRQAMLEAEYNAAKAVLTSWTKNAAQLWRSAERLENLKDYKDSAQLAAECYKNAKAIELQEKIESARRLMYRENNYQEGAEILETIQDSEEAQKLLEICRQKIQEMEKKRKKTKRILLLMAITIPALILSIVLWVNVVIPELRYQEAVTMMTNGYYSKAIVAFTELDGYKDSQEKILACHYQYGIVLKESGETRLAAVSFGKAGNYKNAREWSFYLWGESADWETVSAGKYHTVALNPDGTVVATGKNDDGQCDVSSWTDIVAVSAGYYHTLGLKSDGTVVAAGYTGGSLCDVSGWTDIVAISAGVQHSVGLKCDGTVVATGYKNNSECDVSSWTDIVAIAAGSYYTLGLKSDGTVVLAGTKTFNRDSVSDWTNIVDIGAGTFFVVGLRSDGTVVAVGDNANGECDVSGWTDIMAISAGAYHTVGLRSNGTVVATGHDTSGETDVSDWANIVAVSAGRYFTVGLRSDGTVVAMGDNEFGQLDVTQCPAIKLPQ